jgi:hypothetical protein
MAIPEARLQAWANHGPVTTAQATHESIRNALNHYRWPPQIDYDVYLQGSYKNSTNIRGDSDVDMVVQLNSTFLKDLSGLTAEERTLYGQAYPTATYTLESFRTDVLAALRAYYGTQAIIEGNKSIKLASAGGRMPADVVVCLRYKKYTRFRSLNDEGYIEGITFFTRREGRQIINFPKPHYQNGVDKNQRTSQWYKPTVRMFKNARTYLIDNSQVGANIAPSYLLECAIYNAPDNYFGADYQQTFTRCINFLHYARVNNTLDSLQCQNGQQRLFGNTPEQWNTADAGQTMTALINLWNNWR